MPNRLLFSIFTLPFAATALASSLWASPLGSSQRTFATPQEAARDLLAAAEADDLGALNKSFGSGAEEIPNSGDAVEDKNNR